VEFVVYRRLLYFLDLGSGSGSGSETIDIDRLMRMNWDLDYLLQRLILSTDSVDCVLRSFVILSSMHC